ncbi:MAG: helix-turn-helix domain-containing protein [Chloroflexi bacterium]|nr:helix-turn-helix domain-containing protein [Chloroflexota bacterium]
MATSLQDMMTVREAARECRRTAETVRRWIWEGKLPAQKLGNQLFVRRADVMRMTASAKRSDKQTQMALVAEIKALRERIRRRVGTFDILEALDRSREAHP